MNLKKLIIPAALIHLAAAIFSTGNYHPDEHFQIIEFAGTKLGFQKGEDLPWEYDARMRPGLQPLIVFAAVKAFRFLGWENPFYQAMFLRMLSAGLGLLCMILLFSVFQKEIRPDRLRTWLARLSLFLWFLTYLHARFSSETWSGSIFFIGLAFYMKKEQEQALKTRDFLLTGAFIGLAFVLRYQTAFLSAGFLAWLLFIRREKIPSFVLLACGFFISFFLGALADRWLYGTWTFTAWNYLDLNIIQDKVSAFGVSPWHYYIRAVFLNAVPPYSVLLLASPLLLCILFPRHLLSWILLPFLLVHQLIGHKELRFLFPLANMAPVLVILVLAKFLEHGRLVRIRDFFIRIFHGWFVRSFWILNLILLAIVTFKPSGSLDAFYQFVYNRRYAKIYYTGGENPYVSTGKFWRHFYKRKDLEVLKAENLAEVRKILSGSKEKLYLMAYRYSIADDLAREKFRHRLVFRNIPEWTRHFNINRWQERTKIISLYEILPES